MAKTVVANAYGGPEVLEVIDEDLPDPGPGQVVVEMRAIGVNPIDYKLYSGEFGRDPTRLPVRPGVEGAGVVVAVGDENGDVRVGEEVIVYAGAGAYSERVLASAEDVLPKPESVSWEAAACLLVAGGTAVDALTVTRVGEGDVVVVQGAAGGVGELVVQLAAARGAIVVGVAREKHHDFLRTLGAAPVLPGAGLPERIRALAPDGVDAVIDTVGTDDVVDASLALGAHLDRIVTIVAFERAARDGFLAIGAGNENSDRIRREARPILIDMAGHGGLEVAVGTRFPLVEAAAAHRAFKEPHARGKFVLIP
ncbi:NADP-dependent oxidoreductase [Prescottella agglutinans]|uniref:NADP-dependent oxidoreductase n=1 Tax=Prescottella agglutinans TaxID=1644129 RepID=UPI003D96FD0F